MRAETSVLEAAGPPDRRQKGPHPFLRPAVYPATLLLFPFSPHFEQTLPWEMAHADRILAGTPTASSGHGPKETKPKGLGGFLLEIFLSLEMFYFLTFLQFLFFFL